VVWQTWCCRIEALATAKLVVGSAITTVQPVRCSLKRRRSENV